MIHGLVAAGLEGVATGFAFWALLGVVCAVAGLWPEREAAPPRTPAAIPVRTPYRFAPLHRPERLGAPRRSAVPVHHTAPPRRRVA